ncbi:MAG: fibronectin type III domain-containing protein [Candidatus Eisenbacteria bacterium]|nr:fibronectin type III domain-containing protein [Candidatus Eisenbacteria bacterium]
MRARKRLAIVGFVVLLAAGGAGCSKEHSFDAGQNPRDPYAGGVRPPVPTGVGATVGNRRVAVSWQLPDSSVASRVRSYRVYRKDPVSGEIELADSSGTSPCAVEGLANGASAWFSVSAVLDNGLEGVRSREALATPGLYAVAIADGRPVTNARSVLVDLRGPSGTAAVTLGSAADLSGSSPVGFASRLAWTLEEGDGDKRVYARFTDADGNPSEIVGDAIRLDTRAEISDFSFSGSESRSPGEIVVFTLVAGETGGQAEVEITRGGPRRAMRDDGSAPDLAAADGVFVLAYEAESSHQFLAAEMVGHFLDEAGNEAPELAAPRLLTVHADPPAVVLETPTSAGPREITLHWSRAPEGLPFASYVVYRSESPGVATDPSRRLLQEISSRSQTSATDTGLPPESTYYYVVEVVDPLGFSTPSNEVMGRPIANDAPAGVVLDPPFGVTAREVHLSWSRNFDADFSAYRLIRGERNDVLRDPNRKILITIQSSATTTHTDASEIEEGATYRYVVEVVDAFGAASVSNEVAAVIDDLYPAAVTLSAPDPVGQTTIGLSWTASEERDFQSYRLYRSPSAGVGEDDQLIATITEAERTRWIDQGLQTNQSYYYRVYVRDKGGHASPSNEIMVTTAGNMP